jgi:hypothetical protein
VESNECRPALWDGEAGPRHQVVHDDVPAARRVDGVDEVAQLDERVAVVLLRREADRLAAADVERAHPAERAVPNVLELATHRLAERHRDIRVPALERLDLTPDG